MTVFEFNNLIKKNNIPDTAELICDSRWECNGLIAEDVFYDSENNVLILTQKQDEIDVTPYSETYLNGNFPYSAHKVVYYKNPIKLE